MVKTGLHLYPVGAADYAGVLSHRHYPLVLGTYFVGFAVLLFCTVVRHYTAYAVEVGLVGEKLRAAFGKISVSVFVRYHIDGVCQNVFYGKAGKVTAVFGGNSVLKQERVGLGKRACFEKF